MLLLEAPYDGDPHAAGNGQMVALTAANRATVDLAYQAALDHGAMPERRPQIRTSFHFSPSLRSQAAGLNTKRPATGVNVISPK